ncbi:MAG: LysM peptidoglycan-binding domain-containing protein [Cytophagaceae bacterium]|nr:LysM peptidoglycan-binding domain-containing protein [Cytophagaceae bacterium]MDW8456097.1 LysM peptidoglycan-binding domain-containing protein [Cytophagaceae bacterium]
MCKNVFSFFAAILVVAFTNAGIKDSVGVTKVNNKLHILYLVSPGETIYGISTKYGVPVSDLLEINPELENGLKVGQIIQIPYNPELRTSAETDTNAIIHIVQPGETLYGLAKKYNTSVNEILRMNGMELKAGQKIIVGYKNKPKSASNTPSTPPTKSESKSQPDEPSRKNTSLSSVPSYKPYPYDPEKKQVLVIPFDPYLYFSDADAEIAAKSNIPMPKVRQVFRNRLNALLDVQGYETIHLLGGKSPDSTSDLNKVYSSVGYEYREVMYNPDNPRNEEFYKSQYPNSDKGGLKAWMEKQKNKLQAPSDSKYDIQKDHGSYFAVKIRNPEFFNYFNTKYSVDYYIFITQFEVKTNYENCLDRAALNYERTFTTHYTIFDSTGRQIAGNKFKTHYNSNTNHVFTIVADNMPKIADRIMSDIPPPYKKP